MADTIVTADDFAPLEIERMHYFEPEDRLVVEKVYDPTSLVEENREERAINGRPKLSDRGLTRVASIPLTHIEALAKAGYNLLSPDQQEVRRALCYIQDNEPDWMVVDGKPFAMWRPKWR